MKLSIIIPVYKVEKYIEHCLISIFNQDMAFDEYEVIAINDGSPDKSREIIFAYAEKYPNLIFIDQENQGVSVARNRGLEIAKGDYIAFIDPDDSVHPKALKSILERAYKDDIDILYLGLEFCDENGNFIGNVEKNGDDAVISDGFTHQRRTYPATLYKRKTIGSIRFVKGIIRGQDTVFNVMVQSMAKKCGYCSVPYYIYLQRESSSRQFVGTEKNFISSLLAIETIEDFRKMHFPNQAAIQKEYFDNALLIFIRRTLEWNILPQSNKRSFNILKSKLKEMELDYLIQATAKNFPMFDKHFLTFMAYRKLKGYYHMAVGKLRLW